MKRNSILAAVIAGFIFCSGFTGCSPRPQEQVCASQPVVVHDKQVVYVPIDAGLTRKVPNPGPQLKRGSGATVGDAVDAALACDSALGKANRKLACIATIQGKEAPAASDCVGTQ